MKARITIDTVIEIGDFEGYEDYRDAAWDAFCAKIANYYMSADVKYDVVAED